MTDWGAGEERAKQGPQIQQVTGFVCENLLFNINDFGGMAIVNSCLSAR